MRKTVLGLVPVSLTVFLADASKTNNGTSSSMPCNKDGGDDPADDAAASEAPAEKGKKEADEKTKLAQMEVMKIQSKLRHAISSENIGGVRIDSGGDNRGGGIVAQPFHG